MSAAIPDNVWIDAAQLTALRAELAASEGREKRLREALDALEQQVERLREALEEISGPHAPDYLGCRMVARAALGEE